METIELVIKYFIENNLIIDKEQPCIEKAFLIKNGQMILIIHQNNINILYSIKNDFKLVQFTCYLQELVDYIIYPNSIKVLCKKNKYDVGCIIDSYNEHQKIYKLKFEAFRISSPISTSIRVQIDESITTVKNDLLKFNNFKV